jgi:hypothetical protein
MARPIGGFLPLRIPASAPPSHSVFSLWIGQTAEAWLLHNARSALHTLWNTLSPPRVWLPAYVCREVAAAVPLHVESRYYPLRGGLLPDIEFLALHVQNGDHVLAIDYFGRPASPDFLSLVHARPDVGWIEDRAHALDAANIAWGDWLLYSPRKLFGVPDGGILVSRQKPLWPITPARPTDFSFALPSLERFEDCDETENERWYASYVRVEAAMGIGLQAMSLLSRAALTASDPVADREVRRSNYQLLHRRLGEWSFFTNPEISFAPLGFPLRVKSAETLCDALSRKRIFAARHWRSLPSDAAIFASEHQLARELVTLPCDYRYGESEMHRVADAVLEAMSTGA